MFALADSILGSTSQMMSFVFWTGGVVACSYASQVPGDSEDGTQAEQCIPAW